MQEYIRGSLFIAATVGAGYISSQLIPALNQATTTILAGVLIGNCLSAVDPGPRGIRLFEKHVLSIAIALLGFELELSSIGGLDPRMFLAVAGVVAISMFLGTFAARLFSLSPKLGMLLGVGSGICGSAAIMAAAPVIKAGTRETGIAVAVVNLLGTLGIFLLPALVSALGLEPSAGGMVIGGTLQAVGQTIAAALRLGPEAVRIAAIVKMARVLLLGVVLIGLSLRFGTDRMRRFPLPVFILFFLLNGIAVNILPLPEALIAGILQLKNWMFLTAMAAIGLNIRLGGLRVSGIQALLVGSGIFTANIIWVIALL